MNHWKKVAFTLTLVIAALLWQSSTILANEPCIIPDNGTGTISLPADCPYTAPYETMVIIDGLPPGTTIELDPTFQYFFCEEITLCSMMLPPGECEDVGGSLGGHFHCFKASLDLDVNGTGELEGFHRMLSVPVEIEIHTGPRNPGDPVQAFPGEVYTLYGELLGDPDFCVFRIIAGSDFGLPCPGQYTLTELPDGDFAVDSFFDITYQIEFEGCPGSVLEGFSGTTTATIRIKQGVTFIAGQDVAPGVDLCATPPDSNTTVRFGGPDCPAIPADFFGPGSDPFEGMVVLEGSPLETTPPGILGETDVIVERLDVADIPVCGGSDDVDIELIALSLVSVSPITVTYDGGMYWKDYYVHMCLSSVAIQPVGTMTITQECDSGGTFTAGLPVNPKFIFTLVDPPHDQFIWDWEGYNTITLLTYTGHYMYSDPGFNVTTSPGGLLVDHDCDGTMDVTVGPSSNFYWGLYPDPCDCFTPPTDYDILMTYWYGDCATHGCLPPLGPSDFDVLPGVSLCYSPPDSNTSIRFGDPGGCPPIPADFFGPGSDPFDGLVVLEGVPLETTPDNILGDANAVIERLEVANLPSCPSTDNVEIEIIALNLVSMSPITVTYNGGMSPEPWEVHVCLSGTTPQETGMMDITMECDSGGTFTAELPVIPKIIFTQLVPPFSEWIWDWGGEFPPILLQTITGHWLYSDPGFNITTSPGGVLVDHDCDGVEDVTVHPSTNFFPNVFGAPCDCFNPPTTFNTLMTYWYANCASLGCMPPTSMGYAYLPGDVNMFNGSWPPSVIGGDVTYLVNYFRGITTSYPCYLSGFWCSADANGDCNIIGSDVTFLINYLRGGPLPRNCVDYPPLYPPIPPTPPTGWPNCGR